MLIKPLLLTCLCFLVGCSTTQVKFSFPTPPEILMQPPEKLTVLKPAPDSKVEK